MRIPRQPSPVQNVTDQKQPHNVEYINYLGRMITNGARCTPGNKIQVLDGKSKFQQGEKYFHRQIKLKFKDEISNVLISNVAFYGPETWTIRIVD